MRLCSGCQTKVEDHVRFCDACRAERTPVVVSDDIRSNSVVRYDGAYDAELDHLNKGTRWQQKTRPAVLRRDPMCKRCDIAVSVIVDHIVPAAIAIAQAIASKLWPCDKYAGYYLTSNLQGLCRLCHAAKTAEDKAHVGAWP